MATELEDHNQGQKDGATAGFLDSLVMATNPLLSTAYKRGFRHAVQQQTVKKAEEEPRGRRAGSETSTTSTSDDGDMPWVLTLLLAFFALVIGGTVALLGWIIQRPWRVAVALLVAGGIAIASRQELRLKDARLQEPVATETVAHVVPATIPSVPPSIPGHIKSLQASVLQAWLTNKPNFRPAESKDCDCDQDLAAARQSWENQHPYYVLADFNADSNEDFAVVLLDSQSTHEWGWDAALAVFNGPLRPGMSPSFFKEHVGSPKALLFHRSGGPLLLGPWESEGVALTPRGAMYVLE